MSWVRIDDGIIEREEFDFPDEEDAAFALWMRALLYSSRMRTQSFVQSQLVLALSKSENPLRAVEHLVARGLWKRRADGFIILGGGKFWSRYSDGYWSKAAYAEVYARDLATCRYCGSHGGGDHAGNLVVACWTCNRKKSGRTPEQAGMVLRPVPAVYVPPLRGGI